LGVVFALLLRSNVVGPWLWLGWGVVALVSGATWLRRYYRNWVSLAFTLGDVAVLAAGMDSIQHLGLSLPPPSRAHMLYGSGIALMLILSTNMLRFSWRTALVTVAA